MKTRAAFRHLIVVLGDQLNSNSAAFDEFDPLVDAVWMAEVAQESEKVWVSKPRIAVFLAAMRHFRDELLRRGWFVIYRQLTVTGAQWSGIKLVSPAPAETFAAQLESTLRSIQVERLILAEPGEWGVREEFIRSASSTGVPLDLRPDRHFLCESSEFAAHAGARKTLRMEFFYREMRRKTGVLMEGDKPVGGQWNFDHENREAFGKNGPPVIPSPKCFAPDETTRGVLRLVSRRFANHPGSLTHFDWPVTAQDARLALQDFVAHRLADFGRYQDAMWTNEPWLYHSRLSAAMNLKLLDPREVIAAAEKAYETGRAGLAAVEGFIRQILGWREYVRGVYWQFMPEYAGRNAMQAGQELPALYWTGETEMRCLGESIRQTLDYGYAHHIQRLMVTGLFALLLGVNPRRVHEWYLAVYVDAVEWVELPNTLGMSQFADGGVMASKPYVATGKYIQRMSNYCAGCRYDPALKTGPKACPFTTLYWDYLLRHEPGLRGNQRMAMQLRNLDRLSPADREAVRKQACAFRGTMAEKS